MKSASCRLGSIETKHTKCISTCLRGMDVFACICMCECVRVSAIL